MSQLTVFGGNALKVIGSLAPTVATALGGPFAGAAVSALEKVFGLAPGSGAPAIENTILAGNPDDLAKVKIAELDLQKTLADLGVQEEQLRLVDVDSARKREEVVKDSTPALLAWLTVLGFFTIIGILVKIDIPARNEPVVYALVGALGAAMQQVLGYYFGSSKGSSDKTQSLIAAVQAK